MENIVNSAGQYLQLIDEICAVNHNTEFYFRGSPKQYDNLEATLFRPGKKNLKSYRKMKKEFARQVMSEIGALDDNTFLAFCCQYSLPTNLIEITENALVALYFACEDEGENDGLVHLFPRGSFSDITNYVTRDTDSLICKSDFEIMFNDDEGTLFDFDFAPKFEWNLDILCSIYDSSDGFSPQMHCDTIDDFIDILLPEPVAQTRTEIELEFFSQLPPLLYRPIMPFRTGLDRNGFFILQDYIYQAECGIMRKQQIKTDYEIVIRKEKKEDIIRQLDGLGINKASIKGDLTSIAEYIVRKNS